MRPNFCLSPVFIGIFLTGYGFAVEDMRLLRFPDINKDLIAFVYAVDIWTILIGCAVSNSKQV